MKKQMFLFTPLSHCKYSNTERNIYHFIISEAELNNFKFYDKNSIDYFFPADYF